MLVEARQIIAFILLHFYSFHRNSVASCGYVEALLKLYQRESLHACTFKVNAKEMGQQMVSKASLINKLNEGFTGSDEERGNKKTR